MRRKPENELPTHSLQWQTEDGKPLAAWRVRLLNRDGTLKQEGKRFFTAIVDPQQHPGMHLIANVPEDRLRPIIPQPSIARMLCDRYGMHARKVRGKEAYVLSWRQAANEDAPSRWSKEDMLVVDLATMLDEQRLRAAVEAALRPETLPSR